jgi:ABC-type dipeptide/oligopeptide/nickel transport system permease component
MLRYISTRVLYTLPVIWLVVSLVFLLIHLVPGDPILQMLGEGAPASTPRVMPTVSTFRSGSSTSITGRAWCMAISGDRCASMKA